MQNAAISFTGQVALVSGAGRGLGRSYCLALAQRGATVLVNDISAEHADAVVAAIQNEGGQASADSHSVAEAAGAQALVDAALEHHGRLDIVINNAGIMRNGYLEDLPPEKLDAVLAVHLRGSFLLTRAAWPIMRRQGYGRVIMTSSAGGLFAMPGAANYAAAKAGLYGLGRALAQEGAALGIRVNTILPRAATTINAGDPIPDYARHANYPSGMNEALASRRTTEAVTPLVLYLASRQCAVNGEAFSAAFGRYCRVFVGTTPGWLADDVATVRPEDFAARMAQICATEGYAVPQDLFDEVKTIAHTLGVAGV